MQKRSPTQVFQVALAALALAATLMALYVQLFERRSRQEEDRLLASRLAGALEESRARLQADIVKELRAELSRDESSEPKGDQPLPGAVLRRSESGRDRVLQQVVAPGSREPVDLARLAERLDLLARQMDQTDRHVRQDLEEVRAEVRREGNVTGKVEGLLLVAVISLVASLATSLFAEARDRKPRPADAHGPREAG